MRVAERVDLPEGWEILEKPTAWNGLVSQNVSSIEEDPDGTLWLGTDLGIERISPAIRRRRADPPPVEFVSGSANGVPVDPARPVELPYRKNRLDMHFAALTFRDPSAVRYRMRIHDDDPWSTPGPDGHFNFVDLPPGRYDLAVAASLDGMRWSPAAAQLAFRVARPWYANPWLIGASLLGLTLAGHLSYRLRAKQRLARESQRTRIAMDLHDEVGSGLGAIAVLAGIAARPELAEPRRADALQRIGSVAQDLTRSLGDIVWSLRTSSGFLDVLWDQLVERARPQFTAGPGKLVLEAPDPVPHQPLSLVVRRNLHLVAYEALHNARRHSGATVVALRLVGDGSSWRLEIEDDGRGLPDEAEHSGRRRGLGLAAMKTRASEMGGAITWDKGTLGGTRVAVSFRTGEG
jgi:signal transduction histidine kinase